MPVELTFLGTSDAFNSAGRAHSAYWIDDAHGAFCVDFGPTSLLACKRLGRDPDTLDAIVFTHLHGDHIGGIAVLLADLQYRARRTRPLHLAGPPGLWPRLMLALDSSYPDVRARGFSFAMPVVHWPVPGEVEVLGRKVRAVAAHHDPEHFACSLRIDTSGKVLAFSGDTGWQPALAELSHDADLLVCECSDLHAGYASHLSLEVLRARRAELTARRIALSHFGVESRGAADEIRALGWHPADDGDLLRL